MAFIKKQFVVILAFLLPLLLIGGLAVSIYFPSMLLSTEYDFVYATCGIGMNNYYDYSCEAHLNNLYVVENGKLLLRSVNPLEDSDSDGIMDVSENYVTRLFLHDTQANEGREITLQEAQSLGLNSLITSPDGVSVESAYNHGGDFLFFDGGSQQGYYLTKGSKRSKLNLVNDNNRSYYYGDFKFIGWVVSK